MDFLFIYICCFLSAFFLFSYGYIINKFILKFNLKNYSEIVLIGTIFLTFIGLITNFISSLNPIFNSFLFFFSFILFLFIKELKLILLIKTLLLISFIGYITFILDSSNTPDAGLYHLPYISILNNEKIIFGSVNLHFRFGHISALQYLSSIFNNLIFNDNGILIPLTIIYSSSILFFYEEFKANKNNLTLKFFNFLCLIFILTSMNRYGELGNDDPAAILCLITIYYFFINFLSRKENSNELFQKLLLFSSYTFLVKQFYALIILFIIYFIFKSYKKVKFINFSNIFSIFFVFLWLIKNLISTGCILYPVTFTCFDKLPWSATKTFNDPKLVSISSEAWAKAYPDRTDLSKNELEYISNNKWIFSWLKENPKVIIQNLSPLILIGLTIILLNLKHFKLNKKTQNILKVVLILKLLVSFYWFLKFPTYRYGSGYLGIFVITLILIFFAKINFTKNINKTLVTILIITSVLIVGKNFKRINENYANYYLDYPWPKKNSFTNENNVNTNKPVFQKNELIYYRAHPYPLCMYSISPCTHFDSKVLKKTIFNYYKLFIPEKIY